MDVVDAGDGWPELVGAEVGQREGGLLAGVGVRPFVRAEDFAGVGGVLERVVGGVQFPADDIHDLAVDGDHRVAEAVELGLGFGFRGLDHECAANWP